MAAFLCCTKLVFGTKYYKDNSVFTISLKGTRFKCFYTECLNVGDWKPCHLAYTNLLTRTLRMAKHSLMFVGLDGGLVFIFFKDLANYSIKLIFFCLFISFHYSLKKLISYDFIFRSHIWLD